MAFDLILPFFPAALQQLILDADVADLCINGSNGVWVERQGVMSKAEGVTIPKEHLNAAIEQIARGLGQDINEQHPFLDTRLPNGSRVAAVYPPCSPGGATLTIRKFNSWFTTYQLVASGTMTAVVRDIAVGAILDRRNVLISGGTGSGKTTTLNAFVAHVPATDRLVVIEKPMELDIRHENAVRWEAVDALPGRTPVTVAQLVAASLRHRPDRIIVGEVRDHSAYDMLQAMNTGHSGSLTTVHADTAMLALNRISDLALSAHSNLDHSFVRTQTANAIHFVLHVNRGRDGARRVTELIRVCGYSAARNEFEVEILFECGSEVRSGHASLRGNQPGKEVKSIAQ
jgi:pilus assembly protein CpaF